MRERDGSTGNASVSEMEAEGGEEVDKVRNKKKQEGQLSQDCGRSTLMRIYCLSNNKPERSKE